MDANTMEVLRSRYFMTHELEWNDVVNRICNEMKKVEKEDNDFINNKVKSSLLNMDFIPGGRILRNIGKLKGSMMNCNVLPIGDSIETIGECVKNCLIIWSYGGGVGINFSSIRPEGTPLSTKGGVASGMISYLKAIDALASTIESGGQRRAAGIAILNVSHPEIFKFINVKKERGIISHFNLSVGVNSKFLEQVEREGSWDLKFGSKIYATVDARELWNQILEGMLDNGEPGLLNWDNLTKNNSYYFSPIISTNPCGEQPLPAYGSCDLGAINLVNFVTQGGSTQWGKLEETIKTGVRFLDNVIDLNYYPTPSLEIEATTSRRIGLGVMGLADYLIIKKLRYGSVKCMAEVEKLFKFIRDKAYLASIELAQKKSVFPAYDRIAYLKASFIRKLPPAIRILIKEKGIRNCNVLTCAPTGTTSLIPNVSSGIEPIIYKAYKRHDKISDRIYIHPLYKKHLLENENKKNIEHFVDITELTPEDHLNMQATIQQYIDSGISKTINLPNETTKEQLSNLLLEYIYDLKGVTVYRNGSREGQPLNRLTDKETIMYINESTNNLEENDVKCSSGACDL